MTPTNEERLKEIEEIYVGCAGTNFEEIHDLLRIARSEMERANRRGELLKEARPILQATGHCGGKECANSGCIACADLITRIQKEIDQ